MLLTSYGNTQVTIKRSVTVTDGPVVPQSYSSTGRRFRVERITITYKWINGRWVVDSQFSIDLVGTVLKKDGSDSLNTHCGHPEYTDWKTREFRGPYAFVQDVVDLIRPSGDVEMPEVAGHYVEWVND